MTKGKQPIYYLLWKLLIGIQTCHVLSIILLANGSFNDVEKAGLIEWFVIKLSRF